MQIFVNEIGEKIMVTSNVFCHEIYIAFASNVFLEVGIGATLTFVLHCPYMVVFTARQQNTPTGDSKSLVVLPFPVVVLLFKTTPYFSLITHPPPFACLLLVLVLPCPLVLIACWSPAEKDEGIFNFVVNYTTFEFFILSSLFIVR